VDNEIFTVFIKRTEYKGVHSGQISLPGGLYKHSDEDLKYTALREANEETGIEIKDVNMLGKLTSLYIPVSNIQVFPYVGVSKRRPVFKPDPFEVKYIIETPLSHLLDSENQKHKIMQIGENEIEIPYFDMHGDHLWGATAMIMSEFLEVVKQVGML
jgi:8-oxo-dGTP pyrophosphatase MutT (NUDIX family)